MTAPRRQPSRSILWWHILAVIGICIVVYGNSVSGAFVWDDEFQIVKNPGIRSLSNIPAAFSTPFWGFANAGEANRTNFYRPLQTVAYTLGYAWGDLSPVPDHVISIALHALACVFLYLICARLFFSPGFSLLAAALFAVHPIHTEAVAWIAGMPDVACGAFYLGAVWAFLNSAGDRKWQWLAASALWYLAALFSKEMAITLPVFLLWFTFSRAPRPVKFRELLLPLAPFVAVTIVYLLLRVHALGFLASTHLNVQAGWMDWITLGILLFGEYIWYALVPYPLIAYHLAPLHLADRTGATLAASLLVALLIGWAWKSRRRVPDVTVWLAGFAILLAPVFYFKGISTTFFAERYLYIPSFAVVILAVALISKTTSKNLIRGAWVLTALFAVVTIARNQDWTGSERLYTETLKAEPDVAQFHINLADILMSRSNDAAARQQLSLALASLAGNTYVQIPYDRYRAEIGIGALDARARNFADAKRHFETALQVFPDGEWGYLYLGGISLEADNDYPRAIEYYKKAIQLGPLNEVARDYLGIAMFNQGKYKEAAGYFEEALKINPTDDAARQHLAMANRAMNP